MWRSAVVASVVLVGCLDADLLPCGDLLCPHGTICLAERATCASPEALAVCAEQENGVLCSVEQLDGSCVDGLCVASTCGDGVTTGREQCDGSDLQLGCAEFRYYGGTLGCTPSCLYDTTACTGSCGDGELQADFEVCDASPVLQCIELGYDYGHNRCSATCTDTSVFDCGRLAPRPVPFASGYLIPPTDVLIAPGLFLATYSVSLYVVRNNVTTTITGEGLTTLAEHAGRVWVAAASAVFEIVGNQLVATPDLGVPANEPTTIAVTSSGDVWALVRSSCATRVLAGTEWQVRPSVPGVNCTALYADGAGNIVATVADQYPYVLAYRWDGATWQPVTLSGSITGINTGRSGTLAVTTTTGVYELAGSTITPVVTGSYSGAVAVGEQYIVGSSRAGMTGPVIPLALPAFTSVRHMPDGGVYLLGGAYVAARLDQYSASTVTSVQARGVATRPDGRFVMWNDMSVFDGTTQSTPGGNLRQVVVAPDNTLVIASSTGVVTGTLGGTFATDARVAPRKISRGTDGTIAVAEDTAVKILAPGAAQWTTLHTAVPMELIGPVVAVTANEVYFTTSELFMARVYRWNGAIAEQVATGTTIGFTQNGFINGTLLPDGNVAFAGGTLLVGRDTTWTTIGTGQLTSAVAGTGVDDIWFTDVAASPFVALGLAHWDGTTLANVRWFGTGAPSGVAATHDLVRVTATDHYGTYVRW